ncbi:MAG: lipase family protein, partial [Oscillospiraceae bacterium]|nr:lipase family protein [Oscillospiraceae bacterium]
MGRDSAMGKGPRRALSALTIALALACGGLTVGSAARGAADPLGHIGDGAVGGGAMGDGAAVGDPAGATVVYVALPQAGGGGAYVTWDDALFAGDPWGFDGGLAYLSSVVSAAAYNPPGDHASEFINGTDERPGALRKLGFTGLESYNYASDAPGGGLRPDADADRHPDTVAYTFGHRAVTVGGAEMTLVAAVVRGTSGNHEWLSNFDMGEGEGDDHRGFARAKDRVLDRLTEYMAANGLYGRDDVMVWVTGHSRGAAVANLLAAGLVGGEGPVGKGKVFAYTFATPNVTQNPAAGGAAAYGYIHNLINAEDFIAYMPLAEWGFGRYGV